MESIYVFLIRNDVWIYILCGLGILWYLGQLIRSRGLLKRAMFGLEKERGRRLLNRSLILVILLAAIIAAVTYVNLSIAPTLPSELLKPPTPTPNIFVTPLSSPTPAGGQATPTLVIAPTVTLASPGGANLPADLQTPDQLQLEPSPEGEQPAFDETGLTQVPTRPGTLCSPTISITAPPDGAIVSTTATFFGTAAADSFAYFDMEVSGPETGGAWTSLPVQGATDPVFDNILGTVDVSSWLSGAHTFRLSVYDSTNELVGQCQVQLAVDTGNS